MTRTCSWVGIYQDARGQISTNVCHAARREEAETYLTPHEGFVLLFVLDVAEWNEIGVRVREQFDRLYAPPRIGVMA